MTSRNSTSDSQSDTVPFGALERPDPGSKPRRQTGRSTQGGADGKPATAKQRATKKSAAKPAHSEAAAERQNSADGSAGADRSDGAEDGERKDFRKGSSRRGAGRRGGRSRRSRGQGEDGEAPAGGESPDEAGRAGGDANRSGEPVAGGAEEGGRSRRRRRRNKKGGQGQQDGAHQPGGKPQGKHGKHGGKGSKAGGHKPGGGKPTGHKPGGHQAGGSKPGQAIGECEGLLVTDKGNHGKLRRRENFFLADNKEDVHVAPRTIDKHGLRDGCIVKGRYGPGYGKHKYDLYEVLEIDGRPPGETKSLRPFKTLTSIDPDFHYAVGDFTKDTCMRVMDLICPVGRGQRGLIVAPPRTGKTTLMRKFAKAIEEHYPDVHLMVLLVDERPEEATEWSRSTKGEVYVSTNDELPKRHVDLCEVVWKRCQRLVELGEDVILLLDSITRMARAYNNVQGNSGKTMSGGLDSRAMERPKQFFGSARNTETAGSLTILGTTLIETGSQMDRVIFEEFKGTGNMELVLSRKLADRRIFPAIDIERSGTRKEEKLHSTQRLRRVNTLRRVLARMNFIEAMELLVTKLDDIERNDDFLARFDVDPEA